MRHLALLVSASASVVALLSQPASAQFQTRIVDPPATFGDNNQVNDINEGEAILASPPAGSTITNGLPDVINEPGGTPGYTGEDFAYEAVGLVDVIGGSSVSGVVLYVNSDDGFRLRVNGVTVSEFPGDTGGSNTASGPLTLNDGDVIRLTHYERGGGEYIRLRLNDDNGPFIGSAASGIDVVPIPEPAALSLLGLGGLGLLARRRRAGA